MNDVIIYIVTSIIEKWQF